MHTLYLPNLNAFISRIGVLDQLLDLGDFCVEIQVSS